MAYSIEEEQEINQLKDWWKENGKTIIVAFILGVGGMFGWRYWQAHQAEQIAQASAQYDALIYSAQQDEQAKKANIEQFVQANSKTAYAVFALLDEAKKATEKQDFAAELQFAKSLITQIFEYARNKNIKTALHVCRGNWSKDESVLLRGPYTSLVDLFESALPDILMLEFSTPRAGELSSLLESEILRQKCILGLGVINPRFFFYCFIGGILMCCDCDALGRGSAGARSNT